MSKRVTAYRVSKKKKRKKVSFKNEQPTQMLKKFFLSAFLE